MKKFLFITITLSFISLQAVAQQSTDEARTGSIYSKIGVGIPVDYTSSSADGMGALGVSFNESNVAGLANPAEWGSTVYSVASGGFSLQRFNGTDYAGSSKSATFSANHFQLQLPIQKSKFGISAAVTPLTRSSYKIYNQDTRIFGSGALSDTLGASVESLGSGGISSIELGFGWRINNNISVGYAGSLVLASLENKITTIFDDLDYQTVEYTLQTSGTGFGSRFGTLITLPNLLKQQDYLRIGASVNLPVTLNAERIQESDKQLGGNAVETIETTEGPGLGDGTIRLPVEINGGITYQLNPALSFTTEGLYEQWSDYTNDFDAGLQDPASLPIVIKQHLE
ncbi:MAG: hypothetical protein U5K69_14975 [Balneolaceae bacterium]|nr:hypothetical protein [Balneolaceae bacterium]